MKPDLPPLWTCPKCGAKLVSANMWHSCGRFKLEDLFARSEPHVFKTFQKFRRMVESCGPVTMIPEKTRVVFMVRMRSAGATVRRTNLRVGLLLERKLPADPRIEKIETFGRSATDTISESTALLSWIGRCSAGSARRATRARRSTSSAAETPFVGEKRAFTDNT